MRPSGDVTEYYWPLTKDENAIKSVEAQKRSFLNVMFCKSISLNYYSFALKLRRAINEIKRNIIDTLVIKNKTQLNVININDIYYVEVTSHTVTYHTKNGEFKSTGTMRQIEEKLSPFHFALCNQCYLVNLRYITSIEGSSLKVGPYELIISRPRRKEFMRNLNLYIAGHLGK